MEKSTPSLNYLKMTVYCALFTALIIIGGFISIPIPIGPVPIALADFFVMVTGLFLGVKYGVISTVLYVFLGAIGLPVYAGGKAGLAVLTGPTGGFLIGYIVMAFVIGLITYKKPSIVRIVIALLAGNIVLYAVGIPWLKTVLHLDWKAAVAAGLTPFVPGIIIKVIVAGALAITLASKFRRTFASEAVEEEEIEE